MEAKAPHLDPIAKTGLVFSASLTPEDFLTNSADLKAQGASISFAKGQPSLHATNVSLTVTYPDGTKTLIQVPLTQMVQPAETVSTLDQSQSPSAPESPAALESAPADSSEQAAPAEAAQGKRRVKRAEPLTTPTKGEIFVDVPLEVDGEKILWMDKILPKDYDAEANTLTLRGQGKPGERLALRGTLRVGDFIGMDNRYIKNDMSPFHSSDLADDILITSDGRWEKTINLNQLHISFSPDLNTVTYHKEDVRTRLDYENLSAYRFYTSFSASYKTDGYGLGLPSSGFQNRNYFKRKKMLINGPNLVFDRNDQSFLLPTITDEVFFTFNDVSFKKINVAENKTDIYLLKPLRSNFSYNYLPEKGLFLNFVYGEHFKPQYKGRSDPKENALSYVEIPDEIMRRYFNNYRSDADGSKLMLAKEPGMFMFKFPVPGIETRSIYNEDGTVKENFQDKMYATNGFLEGTFTLIAYTTRITPVTGEPIGVPDLEAISPEDRQRALANFKAINQDTPHFLKGVSGETGAGGIDSQVTIDEKGNIIVTYDDFSKDRIPYTQIFKKVEQLALVNKPKLQAITPTTVDDMTALEAPEKAAIKAEILLKNPDLVALLKDGENGIDVSPTGDVTITYT
ncbi:hypothetical protein ACMZ6Z_09260, partial [Streptococcus pluranimalium]|uniref:hypothetical protein n=1 Tax=Streptococcus pluranimalium TaxID=82348 RepID=UPI0039FD3292